MNREPEEWLVVGVFVVVGILIIVGVASFFI